MFISTLDVPLSTELLGFSVGGFGRVARSGEGSLLADKYVSHLDGVGRWQAEGSISTDARSAPR
jgi:hypothetical protein